MNSLSLGGRGATVNLGEKGARTTVSVPGSGMSQSEYMRYDGKDGDANDNQAQPQLAQKPSTQKPRDMRKILTIVVMGIIVLAKVVAPMIKQYAK